MSCSADASARRSVSAPADCAGQIPWARQACPGLLARGTQTNAVSSSPGHRHGTRSTVSGSRSAELVGTLCHRGGHADSVTWTGALPRPHPRPRWMAPSCAAPTGCAAEGHDRDQHGSAFEPVQRAHSLTFPGAGARGDARCPPPWRFGTPPSLILVPLHPGVPGRVVAARPGNALSPYCSTHVCMGESASRPMGAYLPPPPPIRTPCNRVDAPRTPGGSLDGGRWRRGMRAERGRAMLKTSVRWLGWGLALPAAGAWRQPEFIRRGRDAHVCRRAGRAVWRAGPLAAAAPQHE